MKAGLVTSLLIFLLTQGSMAQCCDYKLVLVTRFGGSWNGGAVEVLVNSQSIGVYTADAPYVEIPFEVCPEDYVELNYTAGANENAKEYLLFDAAENLIFENGPFPSPGISFSSIMDCSSELIVGSTPCTAIYLDTIQCISADNSTMVSSGFDSYCPGTESVDIWFQMTVPASGNVRIETSSLGDLLGTSMVLWELTTCHVIEEIDCGDYEENTDFSSLIIYNLEPLSEVLLQVWNDGGLDSGVFQVCYEDLGNVTLISSELAIADINAYGVTIPNDPKIDAQLRLIFNENGALNYVNDSANQYFGDIGIEIRGASSASYPQKPYGFETRDSLGENFNFPLLGWPEENDWVLLSNYNDRSLVRNMLSTRLFRQMGHYAPRMSLCEVRVDSVYKGIFTIGEKIKRDAGRVDIAKLTLNDTIGDDVTGGYIFKSDLGTSDFSSWSSEFHPIDHPELDVRFLYNYPKANEILDEQKDYLHAFLDSVETSIYSDEFASPEEGFRKYLDVTSFMDYFLLNELSRNLDGFRKSRFYYKDKNSNGGKLIAGPVWDFDWAWKNIYGCYIGSATDGSNWAHLINDCNTQPPAPGWYVRMLQDSTFANELRCRYEYLRFEAAVIDTTAIYQYIDSVAAQVQNAQVRHFNKWSILGVSAGSNEVGPLSQTYEEEVEKLKTWIALRIAWLDENIPGNCIVSYEPAAEIMYQRMKIDSNQLSMYQVIQTVEGGYAMAGEILFPSDGERDLLLLKVDQYGVEEWSKSYDHGSLETGKGLSQCADGGYIICGETSESASENVGALIMRTDIQGEVLWSKEVGGFGMDEFLRVIELQDGGFLASGTVMASTELADFLLVRFDAQGDTLWTQLLGGDLEDHFYDFSQTEDGGFVLTGSSLSYNQPSSLSDAYLVKIDSDGIIEWAHSFGTVAQERGKQVRQTSDSGFLVCASRIESGLSKVIVIKTDSLGGLEWNRTWSSDENLEVIALELHDNGYFTVGVRSGMEDSIGMDYGILGFDHTGDTLYTKLYETESNEILNSFCAGQDQGVLAVGSTESLNSNGIVNLYLLKTDNQGIAGDCNVLSGTLYEEETSLLTSSGVTTESANLQFEALELVASERTLHDSLLCYVECELLADFSSSVNAICEGETVAFVNSSSSMEEVEWYVDGELLSTEIDFIFTFDTFGTHQVQLRISDGPCEEVTSVEIEVHPIPVVQIETPSMLLCATDAPFPLEALPEGGAFSGPGIVASSFDPVIAGIGQHWLYYDYTDSFDCAQIDSVLMEVDICDGLSEYLINSISIWPNPNEGSFSITSSIALNGFILVDLSGRIVYKESRLIRAGEQLTLDLSRLDNGSYIGLWNSEMGLGRKRILIQR